MYFCTPLKNIDLMSKTRILYISQEITPYLPETEVSSIARHLPQKIQEMGNEIRTFMPRYGCVNERRHQLHEVIRLSGMNLIIDDQDHPLIIKVASIQPARMQVYFIDNEEYFQRKAFLNDAEGNFFLDNDERAIFFSQGVLETIKKLGWAPNFIHCHGWMSALVPLYLKKVFADDPVFADSKVIYSVYDNQFEGALDKRFAEKAQTEDVSLEDLEIVKDPTFLNLNKIGVQYADAVIQGSASIDADLEAHIKSLEKPFLEYQGDNYAEAYSEFYDEVGENVLAD